MQRRLNKRMAPWPTWKPRPERTVGRIFPKEYLSPVSKPQKVTLPLSQWAGLRPPCVRQGKKMVLPTDGMLARGRGTLSCLEHFRE